MTHLINEHIDAKILKNNQRLNYLFKLNNQLTIQPKNNHQNIVNSYVKSSHIPSYMFLADIKDVSDHVNSHRKQAVGSAVAFFLAMVGSASFCAYSQVSDKFTTLGVLALFATAICFSGSLIVLDKLFIKQSDVLNLQNLVRYFEKAGVANDNDH